MPILHAVNAVIPRALAQVFSSYPLIFYRRHNFYPKTLPHTKPFFFSLQTSSYLYIKHASDNKEHHVSNFSLLAK
jgi:hypothetical protein